MAKEYTVGLKVAAYTLNLAESDLLNLVDSGVIDHNFSCGHLFFDEDDLVAYKRNKLLDFIHGVD